MKPDLRMWRQTTRSLVWVHNTRQNWTKFDLGVWTQTTQGVVRNNLSTHRSASAQSTPWSCLSLYNIGFWKFSIRRRVCACVHVCMYYTHTRTHPRTHSMQVWVRACASVHSATLAARVTPFWPIMLLEAKLKGYVLTSTPKFILAYSSDSQYLNLYTKDRLPGCADSSNSKRLLSPLHSSILKYTYWRVCNQTIKSNAWPFTFTNLAANTESALRYNINLSIFMLLSLRFQCSMNRNALFI